MAMRLHGDVGGGKQRGAIEANSAIFIGMKELPQMNPRMRRASPMAALEVRMRMQN